MAELNRELFELLQTEAFEDACITGCKQWNESASYCMKHQPQECPKVKMIEKLYLLPPPLDDKELLKALTDYLCIADDSDSFVASTIISHFLQPKLAEKDREITNKNELIIAIRKDKGMLKEELASLKAQLANAVQLDEDQSLPLDNLNLLGGNSFWHSGYYTGQKDMTANRFKKVKPLQQPEEK